MKRALIVLISFAILGLAAGCEKSETVSSGSPGGSSNTTSDSSSDIQPDGSSGITSGSSSENLKENTVKKPQENGPESKPGYDDVADDTADISARNNTTYLLSATDDLGRTLGLEGDKGIPAYRENKHVGVFYFIWLGGRSAEGPFDISKILRTNPNATSSPVNWVLAGGGMVGQNHWWAESLFGYYRSIDQWVIERDVQMLTDAGVDFIAVDESNVSYYPGQRQVLLKALDKYYKKGFNVPKVTFITKGDSGKKIMNLYEDVYMGQPEYNHLWYRMDGKPLIIGNTLSADISEECREYMTIKWSQFPLESYHDDGFPWLDFSRPQTLYGAQGGGKTIMNVSVAQHSGSKAFSTSAFYGDDSNKTRNYHNGANDKSKDAYLHGYNIAEQFEHAIKTDPDIMFITGWNEWIATRLQSWQDINGNYLEHPIIFVDTADISNSRDIQPMKGGYGDNYYMQMIGYIRKFKGCKTVNSFLNTAAKASKNTIDVKGKFSQWDQVKSYYLDYTGDTIDRDTKGYGGIPYEDTTGRNDLYKMKVTNDDKNIYFYAETMAEIVGMDGKHCMSLFLNTGNNKDTWYGYDFAVNRGAPGSDQMTVEKRSGGKWVSCGTVTYKMDGNRIQLAVPLSMLDYQKSPFTLHFKWADNYQGEDDIWSFYLNGDAAPYGRLNYMYKG